MARPLSTWRPSTFRSTRQRLREDDILIEFIALGRALKVSAIDQRTGIEVSIVGDPRVGEMALSRLAARKLRYVLARRRKNLF